MVYLAGIEIAFYPSVAAALRDLESEAQAVGMPICTNPDQGDLFTVWRYTGVITAKQDEALTWRADRELRSERHGSFSVGWNVRPATAFQAAMSR